ncbi:MAG: RES family NAD+ phosphorylase, partial [Chitinophagaceae bacterium]
MEVYRIGKTKFIHDLSGTGSRLYGGRWNSKGLGVIYTSSYRSLAALELLVHVPLKNLTHDYSLATIHIPENIRIKTITLHHLPDDWQNISMNPSLQEIGNKWMKELQACILKVPSVVIPK